MISQKARSVCGAFDLLRPFPYQGCFDYTIPDQQQCKSNNRSTATPAHPPPSAQSRGRKSRWPRSAKSAALSVLALIANTPDGRTDGRAAVLSLTSEAKISLCSPRSRQYVGNERRGRWGRREGTKRGFLGLNRSTVETAFLRSPTNVRVGRAGGGEEREKPPQKRGGDILGGKQRVTA